MRDLLNPLDLRKRRAIGIHTVSGGNRGAIASSYSRAIAFVPSFSQIIANTATARPRSIVTRIANQTTIDRWIQTIYEGTKQSTIDTALQNISARDEADSKPEFREYPRCCPVISARSCVRSIRRPFVPRSRDDCTFLSLGGEVHVKRNARNASSSDETTALHALLLFAETIDVLFRDIVSPRFRGTMYALCQHTRQTETWVLLSSSFTAAILSL